MANSQDKEPIYLDQEGYEKFKKEIEGLKAKLASIDVERGTACSDAIGDSWHDNFAYDEAVRKENFTVNQLKEKLEELERVVIIEKSNDKNLIEIGDTVVVDMISPTGAVKEHVIKIVASFDLSAGEGVRVVSIESPIGKAIYHKHVGDRSAYIVNGNSFTINIKSRVDDNSKADESGDDKSPRQR